MNPIQKALQILGGVGNFIAPKAKAALIDLPINTAGLAKNFVDYSTAQTDEEKRKQAQEYNVNRQAASDALKQFGFNSDPNTQNQFNPIKYATGILGGAGELASLATPVKGGFLARTVTNAVPGATDAISQGKNLPGVAGETLLTSLLGTGGEKLVKGAGVVTKAIGSKLNDVAENAGVRNLGLTKLDINKLNKNTGETVQSLLKRYNLLGKGASDIQSAIDPIQQSFNDIVEKSGLQVDQNNLFESFAKKIDELKNSNAPELKAKGNQLEEYVTNLFDNKKQDFTGSGITKERKTIDKLVSDFSKSGDAVNASKNRIIRDVLQKSVIGEADKAGLKGLGGKSLQDLGSELNKLYNLEETASSRTPQSTRVPLGLLNAVGAGGGFASGFNGDNGFDLGKATRNALIGAVVPSVINNPKVAQAGIPIGGALAKVGGKLGESQSAQKLLQMLGIKTGIGASNLVSPTNEQSNTAQNDSKDYNSNNIHNNDNITPNTQKSNKIDPNMEVTLTDGSKTTYGALQSKGAFKQVGSAPGAISNDQWKQLALMDLLKTGGKNLNTITAAQKFISPEQQQKPLSVAAQQQVNLAKSGLRGLDDVEKILIDKNGNVKNDVLAKNELPGQLFTREFDAALTRTVEGLLRARSGAAVPDSEVRRYMNKFGPKVGDSQETVKFKLNQLRSDFNDVINGANNTTASDPQTFLNALGM